MNVKVGQMLRARGPTIASEPDVLHSLHVRGCSVMK